MRAVHVLTVVLVLAFCGATATAAPAHDGTQSCSGNARIPDPNDQDCDGVRTDGNGPIDNCPSVRNADQDNTDRTYTPEAPPAEDGSTDPMPGGDAAGDACDADDDADGIPDYRDADGDGVADEVDDNCRLERNPDQLGPETQYGGEKPGGERLCAPGDSDGDGVYDDVDNCPNNFPNPGQEDLDGDRRGDPCDGDDDADGAPDGVDNCPGLPNRGQEDADGDGVGRICDRDELFPPVAVAAADRDAPGLRVSLPSRGRFADLLGGMPTAVHCSEACRLSARLVLSARDARRLRVPRALPESTAFVDAAGRTFLFWRPQRATVRALSRTRVKVIRAKLTVKAVDEAGNAAAASRRVVLRR